MKHWSGITKRWLTSTLLVIVMLLLGVSAVSIVIAHNYYYETVRMALLSHDTDLVSTFFNMKSIKNNEDFYSAAREYIENFVDKNVMEVWVIDSDGNVVLSSTGFEIENDIQMPDYNDALVSELGRAEWSGKYMSGESVMTMTTVISSTGEKPLGALRYIASTEEINTRLLLTIAVILSICLIAVALVVFSGSFFIRSIVRPISNINEMTKRIADGDYAARIDHYKYNDEIGELSRTINNMAEEIGVADKAKNDFISTISHELRTPLTAIKGWGETILQVCDSDTALTKRGIEVIIGESGRLSGIVEELLDFSHMQSGRMTMNKEKIDVLAELDETVFMFKERALRDGIELLYNSTDLPAPMVGDPGRIKQVFLNILDNSFKYTEQGGKINVVADIRDNRLEIKVMDTGCGIAKEDIPKVKQKFYKSNTSVRGSGIGLAVADEIIRLHSGELIIDSVLGQGTTVKIIMPLESSYNPQV